MPRLKKTASKKAKAERTRAELHKFKHGTLKSSSGEKVTDRKQAIAIALSEAGRSNKTKARKKKSKK